MLGEILTIEDQIDMRKQKRKEYDQRKKENYYARPDVKQRIKVYMKVYDAKRKKK